ncbi:peptidase S11 D-alanyl-D-alanine carboxypeptidase 1 [Paenibacillus algicola]|uniref:Peptidase S11 D-alanyl-D-alanine carboxypeptidase 1 n=1 Tax=Paenibacillus algicola TaxID=2565926 RepID=A0A4V1G4J2_9BACL|nr:D-alanyl-D-alanine carboxypeptidase family protein [Paenibacillus algicola]QCT04884.1 peptidase S11 D-alanyl-D-alanine carboxypeptidase 1 [Paenibacillus algicola]
MRKKWFWVVMMMLIAFPAGSLMLAGADSGKRPQTQAKAVVLLDLQSGRILYSHNQNAPLPSASMPKLMTQLLVLDGVRSGVIHWEDKVKVSLAASQSQGNRLRLQAGEVVTVQELFQGVAFYSAEDAAMALAEHMSGTEKDFVHLMNQRSRELGLSPQTVFYPSAQAQQKHPGKDGSKPAASSTRMTAADTALLAAHLITQYPEILDTSSQTQIKIAGKDLYLSSNNWMLPSMAGPYAYEGTDGLKAGYSEQAGYCFTGTAQRGGTRLIAVVLGTGSREQRFEETRRLFDYGFSKNMTLQERLNDWLHPEKATAALF